MNPTPRDDRLVRQLADSAFPAGGLGHSGGVEAAAQLGQLREAGSVARFASEFAWQAGFGSVRAVGEAHASPERVAVVDAAHDVFLTGVVANRASRLQGRTFVTACSESFAVPGVTRLRDAVGEGRLRGHHAPMFGAVAATLGVSRRDALGVWLHGVVRGVLVASVRLGLTEAHEAHAIQHEMAPMLAEVLGQWGALPGATPFPDGGRPVGYPAPR
jgi:urease accessory protein